MQPYGKLFAKVYNQFWGDYADRIAPLIFDFYENMPGNKNRTLLDLCCGTGQLSAFFLDKGYQVIGLDLSEPMLEVAREKLLPYVAAKQAKFILGDAANFSLNEQFGLVVSTYDALNHLPDMSALRGCFSSTYAVLEEAGYFIFDLNTRLGLQYWNSLRVTPGGEVFLFVRGIYDEKTVRAWTKVTGFIRGEDERYERFDETVYNTPFDLEAVKSSLMDIGFRSVHFAIATDLGSPLDNPEEVSKVFIVSQK
jgi:SAM-dependent methyltransferase